MRATRLSVLLSFLTATLSAQWLNYRTPGVPRGRDGKPNLSASAPRTAEGKPDLSGVWMHELTSAAEMVRLYGAVVEEAIKTGGLGMEIGTQHKYVANILLDSDAAMLPGAAEIVRRRAARLNPADVCTGGSSITLPDLLSEPIKIVQSPRMTVILYEGFPPRQIYTDGRGWPKEFDLPAYVGYSVGHWEGDTLVVETRGFNDKGVLDVIGHPQSEAMRVIERYRRRDYGHLEYEMTFDDPRMYTKPFTIRVPHNLLAGGDIFESVCTDNEKDRAHLERR
ncbi:MAG TPA: hypothetical protein VIY49_08530 [Bryobacteraceae bacterium]